MKVTLLRTSCKKHQAKYYDGVFAASWRKSPRIGIMGAIHMGRLLKHAVLAGLTSKRSCSNAEEVSESGKAGGHRIMDRDSRLCPWLIVVNGWAGSTQVQLSGYRRICTCNKASPL
jgi:hypothetical protein